MSHEQFIEQMPSPCVGKNVTAAVLGGGWRSSKREYAIPSELQTHLEPTTSSGVSIGLKRPDKTMRWMGSE